ncbi:hypothetical protein BGZ76_001813 [Entomortierella beljakovae]|nr:hypothetical protein BGZ76_001813 [Entomortierella beljakovae]
MANHYFISTNNEDIFELLDGLDNYGDLMSTIQPRLLHNNINATALSIEHPRLAEENMRKHGEGQQSVKAKYSEPESYYQMGINYEEGNGVAQDYSQAMENYIIAAKMEDPRAQFKIGWLYYHGYSEPQDYSKAMEWYLKAADKRNAFAQFSVGNMYHKGYDIPQDYSEAMEWYLKAAEQGNMLARISIADLYRDGLGVPKDYSSALKWYLEDSSNAIYEDSKLLEWYLECMTGELEINQAAGDLARYGYGVTPQNNFKALKLYTKSPCVGAIRSMGEFYLNGWIVQQDYNHAMELFLLAASRFDAKALYSIGYMYENGYGVLQDCSESVEWYRKASHQGHAESRLKVEYYENGLGGVQLGT